jgi:hemerythrin-like domain-containing protein
MRRLVAEHGELHRLIDAARGAGSTELRSALASFADLLERHVRWEERELFPGAEDQVGAETLAVIGGELERRLVLAGSATRPVRR